MKKIDTVKGIKNLEDKSLKLQNQVDDMCESLDNIKTKVYIDDYPRINAETSDSVRIQRCFDENVNKEIVFGDREYVLDKQITGLNMSLECGTRTIFKATDNFNGDFLFSLYYEGEYDQWFQGTYNYNSYYVNRGIFNCNGVCGGVHSYGGHNNVFRDSLVLSPKTIGVKVGGTTHSTSKYYLNNVTCRNLLAIDSNTAFWVGNSDHHIVDCTAVDTEIGFESQGGSNRFARCHYWVTKDNLISKSVAFLNNGTDCTYFDCFLDTAFNGFKLLKGATITNCCGYNNLKYGMSGNVYFNNRTIEPSIITGGKYTDYATNSFFWSGFPPHPNGEIRDIIANKEIRNNPTTTKYHDYTNILNTSNIQGYNFLDINTKDIVNRCQLSLKLWIVTNTNMTELTVNIKKINEIVSFSWDTEMRDKIKVIKVDSYKYRFVFVSSTMSTDTLITGCNIGDVWGIWKERNLNVDTSKLEMWGILKFYDLEEGKKYDTVEEIEGHLINAFSVDCVTTTGYYDDSGNVVSSANDRIEEQFIEVSPNANYSIYSFSNYVQNIRVFEYNGSKQFIKRSYVALSNDTNLLTFNTTADTKYIKYGITFVVNTPQNEINFAFKHLILLNYNNNLIKNINNYTNNSYLDSVGNIATNTNAVLCNEFIEVNKNSDYIIASLNNHPIIISVCLYDENKIFISRDKLVDSECSTKKFNVGNASYIRIDLSTSSSLVAKKLRAYKSLKMVEDVQYKLK